MNVFCFYDGTTVHGRPTCSHADREHGKLRRRRATLLADHPADTRHVKLSSGIGVVVVPVCSTCWPTVFSTAAWQRPDPAVVARRAFGRTRHD
jgi:hypothetical protein